MMRLQWPSDTEFSAAILPAEVCQSAERIKLNTKALRKNPELDCIQLESSTLSASDGISSQNLVYKPMEDRWPQGDVLNCEVQQTVTVNPERLIKMLTIASTHCCGNVTLGLGSNNTLTVQAASGDKAAFGCLSLAKAD
jgi:hypothetical protein